MPLLNTPFLLKNMQLDKVLMMTGGAIYLIGFAWACIVLFQKTMYSQWTMLTVISFGFITHFIGLYLRALETGGCPLGNTFEIFQFIAWALVLIYLVIGATFRISLLGLFTSGFAVILTLGSFLFADWDYRYTGSLFGGNYWIELHASLAILAYGFFAVLLLTSAMYLLQANSLRKKSIHSFFQFIPSLFDLEKINLRLLTIGTIIFTLSLIIGAFYWVPNPASISLVKLSVTLSVNIIYIIVLYLAWSRRIYAAKLAALSIILFCWAMIALGSLRTPENKIFPSSEEHG